MPHDGLGRAVKFVKLQIVLWRVVVRVEVDFKPLHVLDLVVRLDVVRVLCASTRDLLTPVTLEGVESQSVVTVEQIGAVLPDELRRDTVWLTWVGVVDVECLFPVAVVGETVRLTGAGRIDERIVDWIVEINSGKDVARTRAPCALQRGDIVGHADAVLGLRRDAGNQRRDANYC